MCPSCGWQPGGVSARGSSTGRRSRSPCCSRVGGRCCSDSPPLCCSACCCPSSWSQSCRGSPCGAHPQLLNELSAAGAAGNNGGFPKPADVPHTLKHAGVSKLSFFGIYSGLKKKKQTENNSGCSFVCAAQLSPPQLR